MLSAIASAEPGKWRTSRAEYQRGIMDALSDPHVERVVFMKSAQVGWTEILNNVVGYYISQDPSPILLVQPTVDMGRAWSTDRFAPMIRDTPILTNLISDPRSRDGGNTVLRKEFPGGQLVVAGANSPAGLASRPIRIALFDETDRYPPSAGTEGDPISLGEKRTNNYWNRKILMGSTPTIAGASRIELAFEESDQRRYHIACPHCDKAQTLRWAQVRWTGEDHTTAQYHCAFCGVAWTNAERYMAIRHGEWIASKPFKGIAGFHINELYSPWRKIEDIVKSFLENRKNPETLKTWVNTSLGETWREKGDAPEWERLFERRETLKRGVMPRDALILTAGVDVQKEHLEVAIWAWGENFRSWLVDTFRIEGRADTDEPWPELERAITRAYPVDGGGEARIARVGVDTGGDYTAAVYAQLRRLRHLRCIVPMKGAESYSRSSPISPPTAVDVTEKGRKIRRGLNLYVVSVSFFKSDLYGRLWLKRGENGELPRSWVSLPDWMDAEHVKQLVAEQLVSVSDKRGFTRREWRPLRPRNEQLDMAVYARAALSVIGADRLGDAFWARLGADRRRAAELENLAPLPQGDRDADSAARDDDDEQPAIAPDAIAPEPPPSLAAQVEATARTAAALDAALTRRAAPRVGVTVATAAARVSTGGGRLAGRLA